MILRKAFMGLAVVGKKMFFTLLVLAFVALFHLLDGNGHKQGGAQVG